MTVKTTSRLRITRVVAFQYSTLTAVAIGDFDGAGIGDIAIASKGSNNVTVLLGSRSGLGPAKTSAYAVWTAPTAIALGDVNGDGKAAIVSGNWGSGDVSVVPSP